MPTREVREWRRQNGKCPNCGRDDDSGLARCLVCKEERKNKYHEKGGSGLCTADGCNRQATHDKMCEEHRKDMKVRDKRKRHKIKHDTIMQYGGYKCACP